VYRYYGTIATGECHRGGGRAPGSVIISIKRFLQSKNFQTIVFRYFSTISTGVARRRGVNHGISEDGPEKNPSGFFDCGP